MIPAPMAPVTPVASNAPPNLPLLNMSSDQVGRGWRKPEIGDTVRTSWQYYALFHQDGPTWIMGSYCTSDRHKHDGRALYRRPASVGAWLIVAPRVVVKLWRRLFKVTDVKPTPPPPPVTPMVSSGP